jgi:hypothetical protein
MVCRLQWEYRKYQRWLCLFILVPISDCLTWIILAGTRWRIDEPEGLKTFRLGLFGLDKMGDIPKCVGTLQTALDAVLEESGHIFPQNKKAA